MSRRMIAAAAVMITVACADKDLSMAPTATQVVTGAANVAPCTVEYGQQLIDAGKYKQAIQQFTCVIKLDSTAVEGYRGRIEAQLLLGNYSDAFRDFTRVTAFVEPVHSDAMQTIVAGYTSRLAADPGSIPALTGLSFAHWYAFAYPAAIHVLNQLLAVKPNDVYGTLFRGSSRVLQGAQRAAGAADLEEAIALAPTNPNVRFIVADAYTYGSLRDPQRAFDEATLALQGGLDTPRIRAIRGASYMAFGNVAAAAVEIDLHIDQVTTQLVGAAPLAAGSSVSVDLAPGRTFEIPLPVAAGEVVSVLTSSKDMWDTILVLLAPNGTPLIGGDDFKGYMAGFAGWVAPASGTYRLRVTSFEAVSTGTVVVARK